MLGCESTPDAEQARTVTGDRELRWPLETATLLVTLLQDLKSPDACSLRTRFERMLMMASGFEEVRLRVRTEEPRGTEEAGAAASVATRRDDSNGRGGRNGDGGSGGGRGGGNSGGGGAPASSIAVPWRGGMASLDVITHQPDAPPDEGRLAVVRAAVPLATFVLDAESAVAAQGASGCAPFAQPTEEPGVDGQVAQDDRAVVANRQHDAHGDSKAESASRRAPVAPVVASVRPTLAPLAPVSIGDRHATHMARGSTPPMVPGRAAVDIQAGRTDAKAGRTDAAAVVASVPGAATPVASDVTATVVRDRGDRLLDPSRPPCRLTGSGAEMAKLREEIDRAARTDFAVLIEGETGAGKEMVAHQIHQWSRRRQGPWVPVNCAALVDTLVESELFGIEDRTATGVRGRRGKIEMSHGGTLFLDEVAELTPPIQAKLLRVLQDFTVERVGGHEQRRINARLIVATNRSLAPLVAERAFRSDLFYRVNLLRIYVPPLRERLNDIVELARAFLIEHRELGISRISQSAIEVMWTYGWPGNVRELFNVLADATTRAMTRGSREIAIVDLPEALSQPYRDVLQPSIDRGDTMRAWAGRYVRLTLERCGNNKARACERLGISYHTLQAHLTQIWPRPKHASASRLSERGTPPGIPAPVAAMPVSPPPGGATSGPQDDTAPPSAAVPPNGGRHGVHHDGIDRPGPVADSPVANSPVANSPVADSRGGDVADDRRDTGNGARDSGKPVVRAPPRARALAVGVKQAG